MIALAAAGCAAPEAVGSSESELAQPNDRGSVVNGQVLTDSISGSATQGVRFSAVRSDVVTAEVTLSQPNSRASAFIMDTTLAAALANDDGSAPHNHAKVQFTVRRNSSSDQSDTFWFAFSDQAAAGGTFTLQVKTCDRAASGPNHESWRTYKDPGFNCRGSSLFDCDPGQFRFFNACGCGCATDP